MGSLLLPAASIGGEQNKRNRAAAIARHIRTRIRDDFIIENLEQQQQADAPDGADSATVADDIIALTRKMQLADARLELESKEVRDSIID